MRYFFFVFAIFFAAGAFCADSHLVYVHYGADDANTTNMVFQVADGDIFAFGGVLPAGYAVSGFDYAGIPKQISDHKSMMLLVGINDYLPSRGLNSLESCINDAETMAGLLLAGGYFSSDNGVLLEDSGALTSVIRNCIRAAANQLAPGDLFVYYQSSHGSDSPYSLCTYDSHYTASELASDLAYFQNGVKVVVTLDSCYSGAMIPSSAMAQAVVSELAEIRAKRLSISSAQAKADMKNDITFLTASRGDEESYGGEALSAFTGGLFLGCDVYSDLNGDGMISFAELFVRCLTFFESSNDTRQHPYISNSVLANDIQAFPVPQKSSFGRFFIQDNFCYFLIPSVRQELYLDISTGPISKSPMDVRKFGLKCNMKKAADFIGPLDDSFKISLTLTDPVAKSAKQAFTPVVGDSTLSVNGVQIPITQSGQKIKANKKGTSITFSLVNYYFKPVGKCKYKYNAKKNKYSYKLKYKDECFLHNMFNFESGSQNADIILRDLSAFSCSATAKTAYKEGKKFTAKKSKGKK